MSKLLAVPRRNIVAFAVTIIVLVAFAVGRATADGTLPTGEKPIRLVGFISGTVSQVDASGSAICIIADGRGPGDEHCSVPMLRPGAPKLQTGQHVSVALEWVQVTKDRAIEVFVVYAPPPQQ